MKLANITSISGRIILKSGLHIGAGEMEMRIGGTDNSVIKHPHTNEPFIPGSSLKGKIRSLLEMRSGFMSLTKGRPISTSDLAKAADDDQKKEGRKILKLFGSSGSDTDQDTGIGPSRLSFSDCYLNDDCRNMLRSENLPFFEVKSENTINRISGTAENPRFTERVPAGVIFDFSITIKEMDTDKDENLKDFLLEGLRLLELDALGGSGSRGYGRLEFGFDDEQLASQFADTKPVA